MYVTVGTDNEELDKKHEFFYAAREDSDDNVKNKD